MAISGLHLGIIMLLANSLLLPVLLLYRGYLLRALMVIAIVWLFAAISGFTPSVVRSALMLSVFQLSRVALQRYDSLNVLMVVVIVMLVVDSNYLYDVSFQLSVLAVVGIVVWGVPIMDRMERGEMPGSRFISSLLVSMVAMLWAMPVVAYTFEQVSIMSVIISPIVLVTAYLIVGCGVFALALPLSVAEPFGYAMEYVAELQNRVVASVATWDFANHHLVLSKWCAVVAYTLFVIITLVAWAREQKGVETLSIDE
jgi:competence protein ComEC